MTSPPQTLFERYIARRRPLASILGLALVLILLPYLAAYLDGQLNSLISQGIWRATLVQPVVTIYILVISPYMLRFSADVLRSFRPIVQLDDASYTRLIVSSGSVPRLHEYLAILVGALFGFWWVLSSTEGLGLSWLSIYWIASTAALFGLLAWTIYLSIADTRLTAALHRQPLHIDLFDLTPFKAIGRQSLASALAFLGGILLSLIMSAEPRSVQYIQFWLLYLPIALMAVLIFFLNMRPTHNVLTREKNERLRQIEQRINQLMRSMEDNLDASDQLGQSAQQFTALLAYEQRLQNARTWPYNTTQARTLFFSILLPAATMLLRLLLENYVNL